MIIDIHTHPPRVPDGAIPETPAATVERMLDDAARCDIEAICLLGRFWPYPDEEGIRQINDATLAMVHCAPDRVFGLCFLNPNLPPAFLISEIDRCMEAGLSGVKLEFEVNARDSRLDPIMHKTAERGGFVLHHAWYKTTMKAYEESDPSDIAHLAARHPETRIVMAHVTACGMRGILDVQACPNVLVDTSGSQPFSGIVEYAVEQLGAERVVFGSDVPGRDYACQIGRIMGASLTESQRTSILETNAARLLKLPLPKGVTS